MKLAWLVVAAVGVAFVLLTWDERLPIAVGLVAGFVSGVALRRSLRVQ
ncbi:MAG: hypothetical protein QM811_16630 [Pirellulales bacterium]